MPPISVWSLYSHLGRYSKSLKVALEKVGQTLDAATTKAKPQVQPILVRNTPKQPLHPLARIRQSQSRWYSTSHKTVDTTARHYTTTASNRAGARHDRASFPQSRVATQIRQSAGRAPFASTLRPNLTGGSLGRTAGGYTLGGGGGSARFFSHGPACQAQVVSNVSQAMRAFLVGGQKAQFNGIDPRTGEKRFKTVSALQERTGRTLRSIPRATPGSFVSFPLNPTVTALASLSTVAGFSASEVETNDHLNTSGLLDVLSADFSRTLKDLAAVLNDLKRLSALGDLPITYSGSDLRIHFPGCDAESVEALCAELAVTRGTVVQDAAFDAFAGTEIALLFPFAPSREESEDCTSWYEPANAKKQPIDVRSMFSSSQAYSTQSAQSDSDPEDLMALNPWALGEEYESVRSGGSGYESQEAQSPLEYQGFEGIYRFLEELDAAGR